MIKRSNSGTKPHKKLSGVFNQGQIRFSELIMYLNNTKKLNVSNIF